MRARQNRRDVRAHDRLKVLEERYAAINARTSSLEALGTSSQKAACLAAQQATDAAEAARSPVHAAAAALLLLWRAEKWSTVMCVCLTAAMKCRSRSG